MDARLREPGTGPAATESQFARDLRDGLSRTPREIPCKYFYDRDGSALFEKICALPEYYQTRTEIALLTRHAAEIAKLAGPRAEIVEFGAGALRKIRVLLDALEEPRAYTPIDISGAYLREMTAQLAIGYPTVAMRPTVADFTLPLALPAAIGARRIGFFPGSTIGNFRPAVAQALLRRMGEQLQGGGLLVGVDLVKDPARLHAAYNDAAGITARFNKNLLARANRELGTRFDPSAFAHYAPYNPTAARIEMYLVSLRPQSVRLGGKSFRFAAGEAVHTEDSHKYSLESFRNLAIRAGFIPRAVWVDEEKLFSLHWLEC